MGETFLYEDAFSRNIGWITEWEQQQLRHKRVAIAGMGGVGGVHALTLTRLGIGGFHLSDMDEFEVANFNRQVAATMKTVGQQKVDTVASLVQDINPDLYVKVFGNGIHPKDPEKGWEDNIDEFLDGMDLYVDGLDFFVFDVRRAVFKRAREKGIPVITAGPIGFGTAYLIFTPDGMTFDDYFGIDDSLVAEERYLRFMVGLTPSALHLPYLMDTTRVNIPGKKGPSTIAGAQLAAGVMAAEVAKLLLGRGPVYPVPWHHQFDAYRNRHARKYVPGGNRNPLQKLKIKFAAAQFGKLGKEAFPPYERPSGPDMDQILELARWAPSGDNSQPWEFEVTGEDSLRLHVYDQAEDDVYDYNGQPTIISAGMLVESIRIAATSVGRGMTCRHLSSDGNHHVFEVSLPKQDGIGLDPLYHYVQIRSVNRKSYRRTPLTAAQRDELTAALGDEFAIAWYESDEDKRQQSLINGLSTDVRLNTFEAFHVHKRILDFERNYSPTGVPSTAAGVDPLTAKMMKWSLQSWEKTKTMNKLPGSSFGAKFQMDYTPGKNCAAHFTVSRRSKPAEGDEMHQLIRTGQAWQRFWLTATRLGLALQPAMAPLIFGYYGRHDVAFTEDHNVRGKAIELARQLDAGCQGDPDDMMFRGRLGVPRSRKIGPRSIRKQLGELMFGSR
ncbi:MAG: ThiF family adenylyltransferase [Hyphomicrobiales bacterium]|nr:ThiF family adenylyltransferase [Hyphomicrobiales bacterium]